jgi:hypothetical protein
MEQQKQLFSGRWRAVGVPAASELQLQVALVGHLRYRARPEVVHFHVSNGELLDRRIAAKRKALGVLPGVSDLVFVWRDGDQLKNLFLELKSSRGRMTPEQQAFCERARAAGAAYECVDSIDDALALLKAHGILR